MIDRRDPTGLAVRRLSGGERLALGRRRFRPHHRAGGELDLIGYRQAISWELPIMGKTSRSGGS
jgi:hypothetical protein